MADKDSIAALKAFDFGHLIAFILPGLVAARAAAYYLGSVQSALDKATSGGEGAIGPLVWVLLVGAAAGLTISVMRQQWLDPLFGGIYSWFKMADPDHVGSGKPKRVARPPWRPNYRALSASKDCADLYEKAVANVYRYYQFITNMGIAVSVLSLARWHQVLKVSDGSVSDMLTGSRILGVLGFVLIITGYQQFKGWCRVHNQITEPFTTTVSRPPGTTAAAPIAAATASTPAPSATSEAGTSGTAT
jgi:hypothetical protein